MSAPRRSKVKNAPTPRLVKGTPRSIFVRAPRLMLWSDARDGGKSVLRRRQYPKGKGIKASRDRYCFPGCVPASIASAFHSLPWSYTVVLDAPSFPVFKGYFYAWTGLRDLSAQGKPDRPDTVQPFYILTIASHVPLREYNPRKPTEVHGHMVIGAVTWEQLQTLMSSWGGFVSPNALRKVTHAWGAIHYALAQHPRDSIPEPSRYLPPAVRRRLLRGKDRPARIHRADRESYCHGLVFPPIWSDNLEAIREFFQRAIAGKSRLTPRQRSTRGRGAADSRWNRYRVRLTYAILEPLNLPVQSLPSITSYLFLRLA